MENLSQYDERDYSNRQSMGERLRDGEKLQPNKYAQKVTRRDVGGVIGWGIVAVQLAVKELETGFLRSAWRQLTTPKPAETRSNVRSIEATTILMHDNMVDLGRNIEAINRKNFANRISAAGNSAASDVSASIASPDNDREILTIPDKQDPARAYNLGIGGVYVGDEPQIDLQTLSSILVTVTEGASQDENDTSYTMYKADYKKDAARNWGVDITYQFSKNDQPSTLRYDIQALSELPDDVLNTMIRGTASVIAIAGQSLPSRD